MRDNKVQWQNTYFLQLNNKTCLINLKHSYINKIRNRTGVKVDSKKVKSVRCFYTSHKLPLKNAY
jgi:hypothetical protein